MKEIMIDGTIKEAINSLKKSDSVRKYNEEVIYEFADSLEEEKQILEMPFLEFFDKFLYQEYETFLEDIYVNSEG